MSTGRVSSREAERATLLTVATNASPGTSTWSPSTSGKGGKSSSAQRADVERRGAAEDLDVLLDRPQLERDLVAGQGADDVDDEPGRQDHRALTDDLAVERDAQADLHVGRPQFDPVLGGEELDPGEGLDCAARGCRAGDCLQLSEKRVAPGGDLHAAVASRVEIGT